MKGFPKCLNSKYDYEYIRRNFSESQWRPHWEALLDEKYQWFSVGTLEKGKGKTNKTHKVEMSKDIDGNEVYTQFEYKENPMCAMNRLGFTDNEVKEALNG